MKKSIIYNKWGKMGNLGNQMFELASVAGMGMRYKRGVKITGKWKYQQYFYEVIDDSGEYNQKEISEPSYHFPGWNFWDEAEKQSGENMNVCGWLQTSKYFPSKELVRGLFSFRDEWKQRWDEKWEHVFSRPVIMMGFRVGKDYVDNGNYEILDPLYQISALWKHFPNWMDKYNILVCADNIEYAKKHMDCWNGVYFAHGASDIEQFYLGSKCTHFILPNSTFSWWQAYLGEKEGSVVVRPSKYFKGYLEKTHDDKDFWEKHWTEHDYKGEKLDMKDAVFAIPVRYDHNDRKENLQMVLRWIEKNFDTRVHIGEQGGVEFSRMRGWNGYTAFSYRQFHRTKMLNDIAEDALFYEKSIFINFDCDNICPIMQIMVGYYLIKYKNADVVYPYNGKVARLSRDRWYKPLMDSGLDFGVFEGQILKGARDIDPISVGHIIMFNLDSFIKGGGENENFISYGPEDVERMERFEKLGYKIVRTGGIVYHMDHWCGPDSSGSNPMFGKNYEELERIRKMSKTELELEIRRKWDWLKIKKGA